MRTYLVSRIWQSVLVVFAVSVLVFFAISASGDVAVLLSPLDASPADIQAVRVSLGLDKPLPIQYLNFVAQALGGDLRSFRFRQPPIDLVMPAMGNSMQLVLGSMALSAVLAVPLGLFAAVRRGRLADLLVLTLALLGQATPVFLLAVLLVWLFAIDLHWLPVSGQGSINHLVLPIVTLTAFNLAVLVRLTRSSVLEVLLEDYVRTAASKGLSPPTIMWRHVLRNAAIPIVALGGVQLATQLSGAVVVETIFSWPGFGKLMYDAVLQRDIPLVMVGSMVAAAAVTFVNLLLDFTYAGIDPRIRFG